MTIEKWIWVIKNVSFIAFILVKKQKIGSEIKKKKK